MLFSLLAAASILQLVTAIHAVPSHAAPSPRKVLLEARSVPPGSLQRRALPEKNVPLQDYFLGTDLQWFGPITVGTPGQNHTVVFDTGSFTLEIASTACGAACSMQQKFDPTKSSTFVDLGKSGTLTFTTGVGVEPVDGDNWTLNVSSARDTVTVAGLAAQNASVLLITDQTPKFSPEPFDGILGLGPQLQPGSVFQSFVAQGLPSLFGMFLTPNAVGQAELTLGGVDESKFNGSLTFISQPNSTGNWILPSLGMAVNGETTSLLSTNRSMIFDSGTSSLCFSKQTTEAIYALISPEIKPVGDLGAYGIACDKISTLPAQLDIQFISQSGEPFNLTVPNEELSVGPFSSNPDICQTFINALEVDIIGGSLFKHYYSAWDIGGSRIGFAPNGF